MASSQRSVQAFYARVFNAFYADPVLELAKELRREGVTYNQLVLQLNETSLPDHQKRELLRKFDRTA